MLNILQTFITNTDLSLLIGRRSVLAIDVRPDSIRILELRNRTNPFRRHLPRFEIVHTLKRDLSIEHTPSESDRFAIITSMLREAKIATRLVAVPLPSGIGRTCLTSVPHDAESLDEWIEEHYERLFEFGPRRDEASLRYEIVAEDDQAIHIELTCTRAKEAMALEEGFIRNGFEVVWMGSAARALKCAHDLMNSHPEKEHILTTGLLDRGLLTVRTHHGGRLVDQQELDYSKFEEIPSLLTASTSEIQESPSNGARGILLGSRDPLDDGGSLQGLESAKILGGKIEDTHLVGLAASAFYPELAGVSVVSPNSVASREGRVAKALFERLVLSLGVAILLLLGGMALVTSYFEDRLEKTNEAILRSGVSVQGLGRLEGEVNDLRRRLDGRENEGSLTSVLIYQLGRLIPDSVYFSSLTMAREAGGTLQLSLTGYAERPSRLAAMLAILERNEPFRGVKLLRSVSASTPTPTPIVMPASLRRPPCVIYEVSIPDVRGEE